MVGVVIRHTYLFNCNQCSSLSYFRTLIWGVAGYLPSVQKVGYYQDLVLMDSMTLQDQCQRSREGFSEQLQDQCGW